MTAMRAPSAEEQALRRLPSSSAASSRWSATRPPPPSARACIPARWFLFTDLCFGLIAYGLALTFRGEVG